MESTVLKMENQLSETQPEKEVKEMNTKTGTEFDDDSGIVTTVLQQASSDNVNEITSDLIQKELNDVSEEWLEEKNSGLVKTNFKVMEDSEHLSKPDLENSAVPEQISLASIQGCNKSDSSNLVNQPIFRKQFVFIKKIVPAIPCQVVSEDVVKESETLVSNDSEECSSGNKRKREKSLNNGLAAPSDATNSLSEPLIKRRRNIKSDGTLQEIDRYCWICHKDGIVTCCATCPRVYHLRCVLLLNTPSEDWVCPECITILDAENIETRSRAMRQLSLDQLCNLLKYALHRMKAYPGTEPFCKPVDQTLFPRYSEFVAHPMDLSQLERNIRRRMYGSTEAFIADTKWILHDCIIFNTHHTKLSSTAKAILKICKQEMSEIEICPDCYLNAHTRKDSWFIEVCRKPHVLLWAKLKGFPFWPAKVMRTNRENMVDVRFFGAHDRAWVPVRDCFLYSKSIPTIARNKKKHNLEACVAEVEQHIRKLKDRFGQFEYAPFRTLFDPKKEEEQLSLFLPGYQGENAVLRLPFQHRFRPRILRKSSEKPLPVDPQTRLGAFRVSAVNSESSRQINKSKVPVSHEMSADEELTKQAEQRIVSSPTSPLAPGPGRQLRVYSRRRRSPVSSSVPTSSPTPDAATVVKLEPEDVEPPKIGSASLSDWARFEMEAARITMGQHQSNMSDIDCDDFVGEEPVTSETCDLSVVDIAEVKEEQAPEISQPLSSVDTIHHLACENSVQDDEGLLVPECDETSPVQEAVTATQHPDTSQTSSIEHLKNVPSVQEKEGEIINVSETTDKPPASGESDMESLNITDDDTSSLSSASECAETEIWCGMTKVVDEEKVISFKRTMGSGDSVAGMTLEESPKNLNEHSKSHAFSRKRSHDSDVSPVSPKLASIDSKQKTNGKQLDSSVVTHTSLLEGKHRNVEKFDDAIASNSRKGGLLPALIRRLHGTQPRVFLSCNSSDENTQKVGIAITDVKEKENESNNVDHLEVDGCNYSSICSPAGDSSSSSSRSSLSSTSSSESGGSNSTNGSSDSSKSSSSDSSSNQSYSSDSSSRDVSDAIQLDEKKSEPEESTNHNESKNSTSKSENATVDLVTKVSEVVVEKAKRGDETSVPDTVPHTVSKESPEITEQRNKEEMYRLPEMEKSNILDSEEAAVRKHEGIDEKMDVEENEAKESFVNYEEEVACEKIETKLIIGAIKDKMVKRQNGKEVKDDVMTNITDNGELEDKEKEETLAECRKDVMRENKDGSTINDTNYLHEKMLGKMNAETDTKQNSVHDNEESDKHQDVAENYEETDKEQYAVQENEQADKKHNALPENIEKKNGVQQSSETVGEQDSIQGREETDENLGDVKRDEKSEVLAKNNLEENFTSIELGKQTKCESFVSKNYNNLDVNKVTVQKHQEKESNDENITDRTNIEEIGNKSLETESNEEKLHSKLDDEMKTDGEKNTSGEFGAQYNKELFLKADLENAEIKAAVGNEKTDDFIKQPAKKKGQRKGEERKKEKDQIVSKSSKIDMEETCSTKSKTVSEKLLALPSELVPSNELSLITCIKQEPLDVDEDVSAHEEENDVSLTMMSLGGGGVHDRRSLLESTADERDHASSNTLSDKDGGVLPSYLYPSVTITVDNDKRVETNGLSNSLVDANISQESSSQGDGTINIEEVKASVGLPRAISLSVIATNTSNSGGGKDSNLSSMTSGCENSSYDNSEHCGAPTILTTPMGYTVTAHNGLEISTHPAPSTPSMQPKATTSAPPPSQGRARKSFPNRPHPQVKITRSLSSGPGGKNFIVNSRRRSTDIRQGPFISLSNNLSSSQNDDTNSGASSVRNSDGPMVYIPPTSARFSGLPNGPTALINADLSTPQNGMGISHSEAAQHQAVTLAGDHLQLQTRQKSLPQQASKCNGVIPPEAGPVSENISKHSLKLAGYMQQTIEDVLRDMSSTGNLEASTKMLQLELEKVHWRYQQEIAELKHNTDLLLVEMRASMMSEQQRAVAEALRQCEVDKQRAIEETKKKQWCTSCGKEALFYCCWNTSYCDYPCQQRHWPQHMASCGQAESMKAREAAENGLPPSGGPAASLIHHAPTTKSYAPSPQPWPDPLPTSNPWSSPSPRGMGSGEMEGDATTGSRSPSPPGEGNERVQAGREWGSLSEAPGAGAAAAAARKSALKRKRCGRCAGCSRSNCGRCPPCLNARTHQVCRERRCSDLQPVEVLPVSSLKKTQLAIPSGGTPTSKGIPLSGVQSHRSRGSAPPYGLMPMPRSPMQVVGRVQPASSTSTGIAASSNITTITSTSATTSCVAFVHTPVNSESSPVILCQVSGRGAASGVGSTAAAAAAAAGFSRPSVPSAGCPPPRPLRSPALLHLRPVVAAAPVVRLP